MPKRDGCAELPFIISTDRRKVDPETRKLIRSHVMRGKNKVKRRRKPRGPLCGEKPQTLTLVANDPVCSPSITRLLCSKFTAVRFADTVEPALVADVLLFSSMASRAMFLLDQYIAPKADAAHMWFAPMLFDAAYLYAACFTIQAYFDRFLARTRSEAAQRRDCVYYAKTVRILQERLALDNDSVRLSDSTIMTVLSLSGHAYTTGDYGSADHHIRGLLQLVSMRGVHTFQGNTKLLIEIIRCDLCAAMDGGSKPLLVPYDNIPWSLTPTSNFGSAPNEIQSGVNCLIDSLDRELAAVWTTTSEFCSLINAAAQTGERNIAEEAFLPYMGSTLYRLLHRRFEVGSLDEAVRLGLLAFSSPIFLHWNRVELPDERFTSTYREALTQLIRIKPDVAPRQRLWLLMVAALAMSHEQDGTAWLTPWLRTDAERCGVLIWEDMRDLLNSVLWIEVVYDQPGRDIFASII